MKTESPFKGNKILVGVLIAIAFGTVFLFMASQIPATTSPSGFTQTIEALGTTTPKPSGGTAFSGGNGSLSAPTFGFLNDSNTGVYLYGADTPAFAAGGVAVFRCSATACTDAGTMTITGAQTLTGATALNGLATFALNPIMPSQSITPTDGATITPTLRNVTLTPAGAVGITLGACTTGNEMVLYNSVNANVVITDTGTAILAGNQTLGQYDALRLNCFGGSWVQTSAVSAN